MIKVTIELHPFGNEDKARLLATVDIANTGGTMQSGNYEYTITYERDDILALHEIKGKIKDWPRQYNDAVQLLAAVLKDAGL